MPGASLRMAHRILPTPAPRAKITRDIRGWGATRANGLRYPSLRTAQDLELRHAAARAGTKKFRENDVSDDLGVSSRGRLRHGLTDEGGSRYDRDPGCSESVARRSTRAQWPRSE